LSQRLALGLATALGLQAAHFSFKAVNFEINADPAVLAWVVWHFSFVLLGLLVIIGIFAYVVAKLLNRQALRPLEEVVASLEAFGSGDLTPRPVDAVAKDEFGRLAAAYNCALVQVTAAFGERDRAEADIRRFTADAAHQLRTPLTVIQGFIGILMKNGVNAQADREHILWTMDKQSRSMASLIDKLTLLDQWRLAQTNPQLIDIGDCVARVLQPLAATAPERDFSFSQEPACYALVDPEEIREALGNVIDNALKYGARAPVSVTVRKDDHDVRVVVADGGPGLSEEEQQHAFERFYRGEQRGVVGSGLGLAIAKRAVERAGGYISLESKRHAGTRVTITLPIPSGSLAK
jgi:two-component system OmpR family sensor kinase